MQITLGQAAKQIGVSKPTLSKAIKSGKLSAQRHEDGSYAIDPAALHQYITAHGHRFTRETPETGEATGESFQLATGGATPETPMETAYDLRFRILEERKAKELAEAQLASLQALLDEIKGDRDHWRDAAKQSLRAITDQRQQPERHGLFGWFRKAS